MDDQRYVELQVPETVGYDPDAETMATAMRRLKAGQSLVGGVLGGLVGSLAGAALWGLVTALTGWQIGIVAIVVGVTAGYGVRIGGKGVEKTFGLIGAGLALLGCVVGNVFAVCGLIAREFSIGFMEVLGQLDLAGAIEMLSATFSPLDLVFYGIAAYEGFRFAYREPTMDEITVELDRADTRVSL